MVWRRRSPPRLQDGGPSKLCVTLKERAWTLRLRPPPCGNPFIPRSRRISLRAFTEMLEHGMVMYDALYAWCRQGKDEVHTWNPTAYR
jgi:hypothetical protein